VNAEVDVMRSPASSGSTAAPASSTAAGIDAPSMERLRRVVMDVLREHLRDLERRGLL
jgi:hypothetical protein